MIVPRVRYWIQSVFRLCVYFCCSESVLLLSIVIRVFRILWRLLFIAPSGDLLRRRQLILGLIFCSTALMLCLALPPNCRRRTSLPKALFLINPYFSFSHGDACRSGSRRGGSRICPLASGVLPFGRCVGHRVGGVLYDDPRLLG
ncbi:hypothetical protein IW262DRAFT_1344133 [Armillaria fumosa]|nr:hypothetical protein IW262DRAFT_1344133 [Armillaria fumosa]